ncbi:MAG: DUF2207 domain-containing protein [Chloroflexi bacterium]|nr:MAG: DUF2207 domain-containing protein [Chloroflexota bacterium]
MTRPDAGWTGKDVAIYLATLSPFVLLFVGAAIGWTIAPLEHLRPTPQNVAAGTATFVLGLMIVRSRWGTRHRVWRSGVVVPEFEPPDGMRPAEADVLLHAKPRRRDVTATVVDLALRGFLRIEERGVGQDPPTWVFEQTDASINDLREYELKTLAGVFTHGPTVSLATLEPRFFVVADLVEEELEREVVRRGWFADPPRRLRSQWATAGWLTALAGIPLTFLFGNAFGLGLAGAAVSAIGVLVYAAAPWRPARTAEGKALTLRAAGFEHFLRTAESERQRFAERERLFEDYLPYAIGFGFVEQWVHGFGLADRPGDFEGPAPARVPLRAGLVGLVSQLDVAGARSAAKEPRRASS